MNLLIVESPTLARQIATILTDGWHIEATRGHLKDLDLKDLCVDMQHDFALQYRINLDHMGTLARLKLSARDAENIYIGTAADREGETIAFHLTELLHDELKSKPVHRITFSTPSESALREAICQPRQIDINLVESQVARRTIDRMVGYLISALAYRVLKASHSIGRVQMAVLYLLGEREIEIRKGLRPGADRYTEETLRAATEARGIGKAGTYDKTMRLLFDKGYVIQKRDHFVLTEHAKSLCAFLARHFPELFVADFTAKMEQQLDQIAAGERSRLDVVREFWRTLSGSYRPLAALYLPYNAPVETTVLGTCPRCGGRLIARSAPNGGRFAGCEHFPRCTGRAAPVILSARRDLAQ